MQVTIPEEVNNKNLSGLPLWVVDVSDPEKNTIITAIQVLSELPEVKAMQGYGFTSTYYSLIHYIPAVEQHII